MGPPCFIRRQLAQSVPAPQENTTTLITEGRMTYNIGNDGLIDPPLPALQPQKVLEPLPVRHRLARFVLLSEVGFLRVGKRSRHRGADQLDELRGVLENHDMLTVVLDEIFRHVGETGDADTPLGSLEVDVFGVDLRKGVELVVRDEEIFEGENVLDCEKG